MVRFRKFLFKLLLGSVISVPLSTFALSWTPTLENPLALKPSAVHATQDAYWIGGRGFIASSTDGENWTLELQGGSEEISALSSWNGTLLAATRDGTLLTRSPSSDGWTQISLARPVLEFETGEDRVLALTANSVLVSTDLDLWTELPTVLRDVVRKTERTNGVLNLPYFTPDHLAYGDGKFVVVGDATRSLWTSPDGVSWEKILANIPPNLEFDGKVYAQDGIWLAAARNEHERIPSLLRSQDLENWEEIRLDGAYQILGFGGHSGQLLVWARLKEGGLAAYRSTDGLVWNQSVVAPAVAGRRGVFPDIVHGPAGYLAADIRLDENDYLGARLRSADGITWTESNPFLELEPAAYIRTGTAGGRIFYSAPLRGIFTTANGIDWNPVTVDQTVKLDSVAWVESAGQWIVLASDGKLLASSDGATWDLISYQLDGQIDGAQLYDLTAFGDTFFAIARPGPDADGVLVSSLDGASWTQAGPDGIPAVSQMASSTEGILVHTPKMRFPVIFDENGANVVGSQKPDWYSTDGLSWEELETDLDGGKRLREPIRLIALGDDFSIVTRDGRVRLWSKAEGIREVQPRTDDRFLNVQSVTKTSVGNYAVFSTNLELAVGTDLQWLKILPSSLEGGLKEVVAEGSLLLAFSLDAAYFPEIEPENYWDLMGRRSDEWIDTEWFGWIYEQEFPWIYHLDHGWIYQVMGSQDSLWNWDAALGAWTWTNSETFPYLYVNGGKSGRWIFYLKDSQTPLRWFYDTYLKDWVPEADFDITVPPPTPPPGE